MKWYQVKERSAGEKRLMLMWYFYKTFGKRFVNFIAFFVTLITFAGAKDLRKYSKEYLTTVSKFTDIKPTLLNQFKHVFSYTKVLTDRMEIFSNNFDYQKLIFENEEDKKLLLNDLEAKNGIFFLCSHLGNTDAMRAFLTDKKNFPSLNVNVFLSKEQCKIFNSFIEKISGELPIKTYPVEDIGIETAIELKESLEKGDIAFIAGDRVAENSNATTFEVDFLNRKAEFPTGSFKLAELMQSPIYFTAVLKGKNDTYKILLEKHAFSTQEKLQTCYAEFLEKSTLKAPLQFYHFYDFFKN